jgi:hypothetical protein
MMRPLIAILAGWAVMVLLAAILKPLGYWEGEEE